MLHGDVVCLGVDEADLRKVERVTAKGAKFIDIGFNEVVISKWSMDYQRFMDADLKITADTDLALPELAKRVKSDQALLSRIERGEATGRPELLRVIARELKVQGFIVSEHMEVWPEALAELGQLVGSGSFRPRETIAQGLESAPSAFLGLLQGKNFGKQLVRLI